MPDLSRSMHQDRRTRAPEAATGTDRSAQGRLGNAALQERLGQQAGEQTASSGDEAWARGRPLKVANPAPTQPGRQERTVLGVRILGTDVSPSALDACERFVTLTLGTRPDVQERLADAGVALVIVPRGRPMTELPEFSALRGGTTFDGRPWEQVRGAGGMRASGGMWAIAVPEENLVQVEPDNDSYGSGYSIGLHEFAHTIQSKGLGRAERREITALYEARRAAGGPWTEAYGASNDQEYFAQATNCFFGENGRVGNNGAEWLRTNDRPMFDFLVRLYGAPPEAQPAR